MKNKNIISFLIIIFSLVAVSLKGECPSGWTSGYVEGYFDPIQPWCYYWVEYCYKCDVVNKKVIYDGISIVSYTRSTVPQSRWEPFKQRILKEVGIAAIRNCFGDLPPCNPPPPPDYTVEIRVSHCWYHENVWFNKFTGSEVWL